MAVTCNASIFYLGSASSEAGIVRERTERKLVYWWKGTMRELMARRWCSVVRKQKSECEVDSLNSLGEIELCCRCVVRSVEGLHNNN